MPGQNLEKQTNCALKLLSMTPALPSNQSSQQLVNSGEEVCEENSDTVIESVEDSRVSFKEWVAVTILCFVNLINYMDRYTLAGKIKLLFSLLTGDVVKLTGIMP